eukprot:275548_1
MASLFVVICILSTVHTINSPSCATSKSYCVSGLAIQTDIKSSICSEYTQVGIVNNCSYFKSSEGYYLYWWPQNALWIISPTFNDSGAVRFCAQHHLDHCTKFQWHMPTANGFAPDLFIQVQPCDYNNTACLATLGTRDYYCFTKGKTSTQIEYIDTIVGKYTFEGCRMNQPYFVMSQPFYPIHLLKDQYTFEIWWNDMLSIWSVGTKDKRNNYVFTVGRYCQQKELQDCNENWKTFVPSTETYTLDSSIIFTNCESLVLRSSIFMHNLVVHTFHTHLTDVAPITYNQNTNEKYNKKTNENVSKEAKYNLYHDSDDPKTIIMKIVIFALARLYLQFMQNKRVNAKHGGTPKMGSKSWKGMKNLHLIWILIKRIINKKKMDPRSLLDSYINTQTKKSSKAFLHFPKVKVSYPGGIRHCEQTLHWKKEFRDKERKICIGLQTSKMIGTKKGAELRQILSLYYLKQIYNSPPSNLQCVQEGVWDSTEGVEVEYKNNDSKKKNQTNRNTNNVNSMNQQPILANGANNNLLGLPDHVPDDIRQICESANEQHKKLLNKNIGQ